MSVMFFMPARRLLFGVAASFVLVINMANISLSQEQEQETEEEIVVRLSVESKKRETILRWNKIDTASDYRAERSDEPSFDRIKATSGWITDTTHVFRNLEYDHTYYYRVGARVEGDTLWSESEQSYHPKPRGIRGFVDVVWFGFYHRFMRRGGPLMWIILFIFLWGVVVASERAWATRLKLIFPYNDQFYSKYKDDQKHKELFDIKFKDKQVTPDFLTRVVAAANREVKRNECFNMFIEGVQYYWRQVQVTGPGELTAGEQEAIKSAQELCQAEEFKDYPIARIFDFGLENHKSRESHVSFEIDRAIESAAANEREKLRKGHSLLWALASMSPMLGLLGTVIGISRSFHELGIHPELSFDEKLPLLATGIYQALFTTVLGLIAAIPLLGLYYYLKDKVDWIYTQWETDTFHVAGRI